MTEHIQGASRRARGRVRSTRAAASTLASDIPAQVEQLADTARETAGRIQETYEEAVEQTRATAASLRQRVKRRPIAAVLTAAFVGYVIGRLIHRRW